MTSTNLAYSVRNLLKRMLWFPALAFFGFLFAGTIASIIPLQRQLRAIVAYTDPYSGAQDLYALVNKAFSYNNIAVGVMLLLGAFAAGLFFFNYLNSRQQVDFFHSLPVKRSGLYLSHFIAGALAVIIPWLLNQLLTLLIIVGMGQGSLISFPNLFAGIGVHLLFFLVLYALTVLAALLAGNGVVAGILAALFWGIGPMMLAVFNWLRMAMQPTWYANEALWQQLYSYSSPAARYISVNVNILPLTGGDILLLLLALAAIMGLGLLAYSRRPSEAAGRALAFAQSRPIIKYPVVLVCMGFVAMMLHEIGDGYEGSFLWFLIGAALGGFISAQIMEIVYAFDFRAIRRRLLALLIITLLFCGVSVCGFLDTFGYNSYLPTAENVVKVELYLSDGQSSGRGSLRYNSYSNYNSLFSEAEAALIAGDSSTKTMLPISSKAGIAAAIAIVDKQMQGTGTDYMYQRNGIWNTVIRYYMADGSVKTRQYSYSLLLYQIADELDAITAEPEYRAAQWPLFTADVDCLRLSSVYAYEYGGKQQDTWNADGYWQEKEDISGLLDVFAYELTAMSSVEQRASMPVGYLVFRQYADAATAAANRANAAVYLEYTYPVYPQFTQTLAELTSMGFPAESWLPRYDHVQSATLYWNPSYTDEYQKMAELVGTKPDMPVATAEMVDKYGYAEQATTTVEYTDPEQIRELIDNSYVSEAAYMNLLVDTNYGSWLVVSYSDIYGNTETQDRQFSWDYTPPGLSASE
jgi:ABC-2 type transport system permease protein